jgi:hypothetical protein
MAPLQVNSQPQLRDRQTFPRICSVVMHTANVEFVFEKSWKNSPPQLIDEYCAIF